jgi:hypothetical protein
MFGRRLAKLRRLGALVALLLTINSSARAQRSVTLAWNLSAGGTIAGYRVYSGVNSQTYATMQDVGTATMATVSNLATGMTYYFAVTAYDVAGLESAFSAEISYAVPPPAATPVSLNLSFTEMQQTLLTGTAPPGYAYDVLASPDLSNWTIIGNVVSDTTGLLEFTEPALATDSARYYRLRQTSP